MPRALYILEDLGKPVRHDPVVPLRGLDAAGVKQEELHGVGVAVVAGGAWA